MIMQIVVLDDETGDFVAADAIKAVVGITKEDGGQGRPGSVVYLQGTEDAFFSKLTPHEIAARIQEALLNRQVNLGQITKEAKQ